ncbi:MAG: FkbM family methyltransferase [Oxalobacteraceae bacterium]|nr:MAG: FkbM family methyltransferase [Oxalobacteraceae bacterium]
MRCGRTSLGKDAKPAKDRPLLDAKRETTKFGKSAREFLEHVRSSERDLNDLGQFFAFAAGMAKQSRGQLFQDLWALWETGTEAPGYFVEFGAADGVYLSNSYLLETRFGWQGVLAEPNPASVPLVRAARSCFVSDKCVFSRSGEHIAFLPANMGELSRIRDIVPDDVHERAGRRTGQAPSEVLVETISLNDLLVQAGAPTRIDYMSVDTEGSEFEILANFDFERWDVRAISVEHNFSPLRDQLYELLTGAGYRRKFRQFSRFDDWYVKA